MSRLQLGEMHRFQSAGEEFVYLVPSAAVFQLDAPSVAVLEALKSGPVESARLSSMIPSETIAELLGVRAIRFEESALPPEPKQMPPDGFPLTTLVLNVTNQCNLSCSYCYEYGEDKIVDTAFGKQPKFMSDQTAEESVDFLLKQSGPLKAVHMTFFGGETLLNFPVLRSTVAYARKKAAEMGKTIDFSLTTNATLLREEIIEFIVENRIGVTISIDGPKEMQDQFRVFHNGKGSYDVVEPKIRELLRRHTSRPIGARVTLTSQTMDVMRIFRHLRDDIGFWEVGFAPVTTSPNRLYSIGGNGFDHMLAQFRTLADEFLQYSIENRHHGFSNVKESVGEIHKGVSKAYPCGAGLGLMGVATDGEVALCHRFAGSEEHRIGSVSTGVDTTVQSQFFEKHHLHGKPECGKCWARPLCSGGCYHEAFVRYGDSGHANLHYCDWIRGWTETCLKVYGELSVRNPAFLAQFDEETEYEASQVS